MTFRISDVTFLLQLPADLTKMHITDGTHPQVTHVSSSQSGCSIASDSGSSSLSDIYQVTAWGLCVGSAATYPVLVPEVLTCLQVGSGTRA